MAAGIATLSSRLPKPVFFGILGALGCLVAWPFGEGLLASAKPVTSGQGGAGPSLVFPAEMTRRLQREGAQTGDVQISLMWNNYNDLDLHCTDPNGEQIFYSHKHSASGGDLDVDMNAGSVRSMEPVENIFWPRGGAPIGTYRVTIHHFANHGGADPSRFQVALKVQGKVQTFDQTISHGDQPIEIAQFTVTPPRPPNPWLEALVIGLWTGLLGVGLALALVTGQNLYLQRAHLSSAQALRLTLGCLAAGLVAGVIGQLFYSAVAHAEAFQFAGQLAGWVLLGGVLGAGLGGFIPNLQRVPAAAAGAVGGGLGAIAFTIATGSAGDSIGRLLVGRLLGALVLGFCIGMMVAIAEAVFREGWLEVSYGPGEIRTVSLGLEPVSVGSDGNCTVFARGAAPVALRYHLEQGRIVCEDVAAGRTIAVQLGDRRVTGAVAVTVHAAGKATPGLPGRQTEPPIRGAAAAPKPEPRGNAPFVLAVSSGARVPLAAGKQLTSAELPGLSALGGGAVAEVSMNPANPSILGLKNLSRHTWTASLPNDDFRQIEPGKNVRLSAGTRIDFGPVQGVVEA